MKCPSCGGSLYYDIEQKKLQCHHCKSLFDPEKLSTDNTAQEDVFAGSRLYICKQCGAELLTDNDEAVTYCSYCGSEAILQSELSGIHRPRYILPFKISKKRCKEIYRQELKGKWYVPKEFRDPEFIEKFRPFYIPYWMYTVQFRRDPFKLEGYQNYYSRGYDYHEEYELKAVLHHDGLYGVPYDASRNFDDSIAEAIAPFKRKGMVDFHPGYLAGMYADKPNVDAGLYEEEVLERATEEAFNDIKTDFGNIELKLPRKKKQQEFLESHLAGEDTVFLPVWFLTWRSRDRVAYAVVNGQTGKIHIDLPADMKQFLFFTLGGAVLLFVLLSLFLSVTSRFVLWFSALLLYLSGRRYYKELKEIRDRENHVFDKGYLLNDEDELPMSEKARARARRRGLSGGNISSPVILLFLFAAMFFSFEVLGFFYDLLVSQTGAIGITAIVLILQLILSLKSLNVARNLKKKHSLLVLLLAMTAIGYSFYTAYSQPVQDWWYYLGSLASLGAAALMCIDLIARYNETSTRPLPSFYERKGGDDHA